MTETNPPSHSPASSEVPQGVRYARWAGHLLGLVLIGLGLTQLIEGAQGFFAHFQALYFIGYGLYLYIPFPKVPDTSWKWVYGLLIGASAAFVFLMIAHVMFAYMDAAEQGERLGVPGFEGMLIFFALMQVPAVLFQRKPDLLD